MTGRPFVLMYRSMNGFSGIHPLGERLKIPLTLLYIRANGIFDCVTTLFRIKFLLAALILVSCGTAEESRYRDTSLLERPPTLIINKQAGAQHETDDSAIPKKQEPGLGEAVTMTESTPPQLKIKQPFDKAWNTLIQAVKLNKIKITDQERNQGHLYVGYDSSNFFEKVTAVLKDGHKEPVYLLLVEENRAETTITAKMANTTEQSSSSGNQDGYYEKPADDSEELLETVYKTLRDDLAEE